MVNGWAPFQTFDIASHISHTIQAASNLNAGGRSIDISPV